MRTTLLLILCLIALSANAEMALSKMQQYEPSKPLTPQQEKELNTKIFNTEVSRNLIHLAHANWNDEAIEGHTTPEFYAKYPSGKFLEYVPYGQLMSFEGVYSVEKIPDGKTLVRATAAFELKKIDVEVIYNYMNGRYLIDDIVITPIEPNNQTLDQVMC